MWRWSYKIIKPSKEQAVFSTYVEVIPSLFLMDYTIQSILHVCGGDPMFNGQGNNAIQYSPRMWRWSYILNLLLNITSVFSTYVEVILSIIEYPSINSRILHVCGGDPNWVFSHAERNKYSPRMWRWSSFDTIILQRIRVFSTYVEVIPWKDSATTKTVSILHVCGGDPAIILFIVAQHVYSPRMWRWS